MFPVQTPMVPRPGLRTQPLQESPGDLTIFYRKNTVINIGTSGERGCPLDNDPKLAVRQYILLLRPFYNFDKMKL